MHTARCAMNSIELKRSQRLLYLRRLYEKAEGRTQPYFLFTDIGREYGWDDSVSDDVSEYLSNEGLIEFNSTSTISLTHWGLKVMEEALANPGTPTRYFPRANIVAFINNNYVVNGDIVGRDQTTTNTAGGDIVGRDQSSS